MMFRGKGQRNGYMSNAEVDVELALQAAYANKTLHERPFTNEELTILTTKPDFWFPQTRVAIYLDGPYHSGVQELRDMGIDRLLERIKVTVLRFPYKPPLSKREKTRIVGEICEKVNGGHR